MSTRRTELSRDRIVATALDLLDAEGEEALSMRRLADALGVAPMSIYHYVSDKDDLRGAVIERVLAEVRPPEPGEPWVATAKRMATSFRAAALDHPAAIRLLLTRPPATAAGSRWQDVRGALRADGLDEEEALRAFRVVSRFVIGWCLAELAQVAAGTTQPDAASDADFAFGVEALVEAMARRRPSS